MENLEHKRIKNKMTEEEIFNEKPDNTWIIVIVSLVLIGLGVIGMKWMLATKPEAKKAVVETWAPSVKVFDLEEIDYTPVILAEGEIESATKTMLISEVAGRVVYISPLLEKGMSIKKGEIVIKIDDADYKTHVILSQSALADAELILAQEEARALQAERDWKKLGRSEAASDLVLRKPQIISAQARIEAAKATVAKAERDLAKTEIKAPFHCMVDKKMIDEGAYVTMMSQIAEVSSVEEYEVRLPLNLNEIEFLGSESGLGKEVLLEAGIGGKVYQWKGTAVRYEGGVDKTTFTMVMVASVRRSAGEDIGRFSLPPVGLFVKAELKGKPMGKFFSIPREALRDGNVVWVFTENAQLELVEVDVVRSERDRMIILPKEKAAKNLTSGDQVIISPIAIPVRGMKLIIDKDHE